MSEQQLPKRQPWEITAAQKKALKAQGHSLKAVVWVGQKGLTESVVNAVSHALRDHELIKVSMSADSSKLRKVESQELARLTGAHVCQNIGRIALLYRRRIHDPIVELPGKAIEAPVKMGETIQ